MTFSRKRRWTIELGKRWLRSDRRSLTRSWLSQVAKKCFYQKSMSLTTWSSRGTLWSTRGSRPGLRHVIWVKTHQLLQARISRSWCCQNRNACLWIVLSWSSALSNHRMLHLRHRRSWKNLVSKRLITVHSCALALKTSINFSLFRTMSAGAHQPRR